MNPHSGSNRGDGHLWNDSINRRRFLKRTGGATVATFVTWNLTSINSRGELIMPPCGHSGHGEHTNGTSSTQLQEKATDWLDLKNAETPNPFLAIFMQAMQDTFPATTTPQSVDLEDKAFDLAEAYGQGLLDLAKEPAKEWFKEQLEEHPFTTAAASLGLATGFLLGANEYLQQSGSAPSLSIPLPSLSHEWECQPPWGGPPGTLEIELEGDLKVRFDGSVSNIDVDEYGIYLRIRFRW